MLSENTFENAWHHACSIPMIFLLWLPIDFAARPYKTVTTQSATVAATSITDSCWENEFKMKRHPLVPCRNLLKIHEAARVHARRSSWGRWACINNCGCSCWVIAQHRQRSFTATCEHLNWLVFLLILFHVCAETELCVGVSLLFILALSSLFCCVVCMCAHNLNSFFLFSLERSWACKPM